MNPNKTILITGATSGFGKAIAEKFAEDGHQLIITGRRQDRLQEVKKDLIRNFNVQVLTLNFDVRHNDQVKAAISSIPDNFRKIDVLVNNAGLALGFGPIQHGAVEDWDQMIDTNIKGLLYMTKYVSEIMCENKSGHIVNIGSLAGKEVYPNGNVYCASKHAVDALNRAMRIDLLPQNIRVSSISPGMAETEFSVVRYKGDEERAKKVYEGMDALTAFDIAEAVYWVVSRPPHVNILDITLTPTRQANTTVTNRK